jgi:hypothetical protein
MVELAQVTLVVFAFFSSIRIVSYVPQILKIAMDQNGATAISYTTWSIWLWANLSTALYAAVNLRDVYLTFVSAVYAFCCLIVLCLTFAKRQQLSVRVVRLSLLRRRYALRMRIMRMTRSGQTIPAGLLECYLAPLCRKMALYDILLLLVGQGRRRQQAAAPLRRGPATASVAAVSELRA